MPITIVIQNFFINFNRSSVFSGATPNEHRWRQGIAWNIFISVSFKNLGSVQNSSTGTLLS